MIERPGAEPSAGAIAATAPPCKRCLRFNAKGAILSLSALPRPQYRARFRPIKLLFAHDNPACGAKGRGNKGETGLNLRIRVRKGNHEAKCKTAGSKPGRCNKIGIRGRLLC